MVTKRIRWVIEEHSQIGFYFYTTTGTKSGHLIHGILSEYYEWDMNKADTKYIFYSQRNA